MPHVPTFFGNTTISTKHIEARILSSKELLLTLTPLIRLQQFPSLLLLVQANPDIASRLTHVILNPFFSKVCQGHFGSPFKHFHRIPPIDTLTPFQQLAGRCAYLMGENHPEGSLGVTAEKWHDIAADYADLEGLSLSIAKARNTTNNAIRYNRSLTTKQIADMQRLGIIAILCHGLGGKLLYAEIWFNLFRYQDRKTKRAIKTLAHDADGYPIRTDAFIALVDTTKQYAEHTETLLNTAVSSCSSDSTLPLLCCFSQEDYEKSHSMQDTIGKTVTTIKKRLGGFSSTH